MEDPTTQLLLSALAMCSPELIHHLSISAGNDPLSGHVREELCNMLECDPDVPFDQGMVEVYSEEWPELLALLPLEASMSRNYAKASSPIISWTPGLGRGKGNQMN
ncbi:MAG: hypothetical protein M3R08_02845 [Bacteroidota bacterium]|nr:hypothetical protein [Bacteroidota bacterium]